MLELAKIYEGGKERGSDFTGIYLYVLKDTDKLKNFMTLDNYLSGPSELGATPPLKYWKISVRAQADYAYHNTTRPPLAFSNFPTALSKPETVNF